MNSKNSPKFQKSLSANERMDDKSDMDDEMMQMKEQAGLEEDEWRRVLDEAR